MCVVVPINREDDIARAIPVRIAFIVFLEYCKEMLGVCFVDVLDTKIVDNERETDRLPFVLLKSWGVCTLCVACLE